MPGWQASIESITLVNRNITKSCFRYERPCPSQLRSVTVDSNNPASLPNRLRQRPQDPHSSTSKVECRPSRPDVEGGKKIDGGRLPYPRLQAQTLHLSIVAGEKIVTPHLNSPITNPCGPHGRNSLRRARAESMQACLVHEG